MPIDTYLAQIRSARYGSEVRDSIVNSISECYTDVQSGVSLAQGVANRANTVVTNAETAANNAVQIANEASTTLNSKITEFDGTVSSKISSYDSTINGKVSEVNSALSTITTKTTSAETATNNAIAAAAVIANLTVHYENVPATSEGSVTYRDFEGHKDLLFRLRRGEKGDSNVVKGDAYPTLEALQAAVLNPSVGDMYNVGASAPYTIYRWTGTTWESQGQIGVNVDSISSETIDNLWSGSATPSGNTTYLDDTGLANLISKILTALSGKVSNVANKGLSTNDYTNADKASVNTIGDTTLPTTAQTITGAIAEITTGLSGKVDSVSGKGLSTNDYTTPEKNKVAVIGTDTLTTTAQTLTGAVNELVGRRIILSDQTFTPSWTASGETNYIYYADLTVNGITSDWFVDVVFSASDANSGYFSPVCQSTTNAVRIWATTNAISSITIKTIAAWR